MIEDDDMLAIFFDTDHFAEVVHVEPITPDAFPAYDITPIFDAKPVDTRSFQNRFPEHGGARPSGSSPHFRIPAKDFPKERDGRATVTIRATQYTVFKVEHDGTGMAHVEVKLVGS